MACSMGLGAAQQSSKRAHICYERPVPICHMAQGNGRKWSTVGLAAHVRSVAPPADAMLPALIASADGSNGGVSSPARSARKSTPAKKV